MSGISAPFRASPLNIPLHQHHTQPLKTLAKKKEKKNTERRKRETSQTACINPSNFHTFPF
jgi:hypothetical protein